MTIELIIRGFLQDRCLWKEEMSIPEQTLETTIGALAELQADKMNSGELDMIEIEFPQEPDPNERYFRIGVNPAGMVCPFEIDLTKLPS